jgi:carboxypeptidase C (cathepsin A)
MAEFKELEFYITGESYAGQYIPTLMDQIHTKGGVNLKVRNFLRSHGHTLAHLTEVSDTGCRGGKWRRRYV